MGFILWVVGRFGFASTDDGTSHLLWDGGGGSLTALGVVDQVVLEHYLFQAVNSLSMISTTSAATQTRLGSAKAIFRLGRVRLRSMRLMCDLPFGR